jgi:hypothetical protein
MIETISVVRVGSKWGCSGDGVLYETFNEAFRRAKYLARWYREIV